MSFYKFNPDDLIDTFISTFPRQVCSYTSTTAVVDGTIALESPFLTTTTWSAYTDDLTPGLASTYGRYSGETLTKKKYQGYSERLGGFLELRGPFSASLNVVAAISGGTNQDLYESVVTLYKYYSLQSSEYLLTASVGFNSATIPSTVRVISIPQIYYERGVLTGSFSASESVGANTINRFYDNGLGGIYSGSGATKFKVGNIFYSEGLVVMHASQLNAVVASTTTTCYFRGDNTIPVKIFRCRAPAGELNCSSNSSYSRIRTDISASNRNEREVRSLINTTYITKVGLYNNNYELVGYATMAHPVRKDEDKSIQIRLRMDW